MKILMINDLYQHLGGVEIYLFNLNKGLEEHGHKVIVLYGKRETRFNAFIEDRTSYFVRFNQSMPLIRDAILHIIKKESPDIVHIHNLGQEDGIYTCIEKLNNLIPVVFTCHCFSLCCPSGQRYFYSGPHICHRNVGPYCLFSMLLNRCFDSKRPWVSLNSYKRTKLFLNSTYVFKKIIVASEFVKSFLVKNGIKKETIEALPYFINMPNLENIEDKNIILFVGRICKGKGLDYLLGALQYIKAPFKLLIIGDGWELNNCKKISQKLGLKDKVEFIGWKTELKDYYRGASVVVVPSIHPEPFGIVGIEAMSYAKPVVAFNVGGICEWLEDKRTGFLVEPYSIKEMARNIELLLRDKTLAMQMGEEGRRRAEIKFNKNKHINRMLEIYTQVIK